MAGYGAIVPEIVVAMQFQHADAVRIFLAVLQKGGHAALEELSACEHSLEGVVCWGLVEGDPEFLLLLLDLEGDAVVVLEEEQTRRHLAHELASQQLQQPA